jgi:hypothetical protein
MKHEDLLNKIVAEASAEREALLAFSEGFTAFARGYEARNKAILVLVETIAANNSTAGVVSGHVSVKEEDKAYLIKDSTKYPTEPKQEEAIPEELAEEKAPAAKKAATKKADKLPTKSEIARSVSSVFVNLTKEQNIEATKQMDALFDKFGMTTADDIFGKPESVEFLSELEDLRQGIAEMEVAAPEKSESKEDMTESEFIASVESFAKSQDPKKREALLKAKERFGVAKAKEILPGGYREFVDFMIDQQEDSNDEF